MTEMIEAAHWSRVDLGSWPFPHFSPEELACRHCGELRIDRAAGETLERLRDGLGGTPLVVNSAYRCPEHNEAVGGAPDSYHMLGQAFDLDLSNHDPKRVEQEARACGFGGIGRYLRPDDSPRFVHLDTGPRREWGAAAWPVGAATRFQPEEKPTPGKTAAKAGGALGAGAAAGAVMNDPAGALDSLTAFVDAAGPWLGGLGLVVILAALGVLLWPRVRRAIHDLRTETGGDR